jgi:glycosyltransferase involved in cell wall biosynthesis
MKIISLMPVKNEAWIIGRTLSALATFCDHIIVADQGSTDGTLQILESFSPQVTIIENPDMTYSNRIRWILLEEARNFEGDNFILLADADEIPTANIMTVEVLDTVTNLTPGTAIEIPWIQLWRHPLWWRDDDSLWSKRWIYVGFRDDRAVKYESVVNINDHKPRIPECRQILRSDNIKLLHYQFVLFDRKRSKECWYRAGEAVALGLDKAADINYYYRVARDERQVHLSPIDPEWVAGWRELGIDLEHFEEEPLYWYDVEVLRWFKEKGPAYFAPLDLWDVDWEAKRQFALAQGFEGIPPEPVVDPRSLEQKLYHAYLGRFQHNPFWRDPKELLHLADRGARWLAKGLGLRRHQLEHWQLLKPKETGGDE